jgi:hypothetical protein
MLTEKVPPQRSGGSKLHECWKSSVLAAIDRVLMAAKDQQVVGEGREADKESQPTVSYRTRS